jgi:hypothetical protein
MTEAKGVWAQYWDDEIQCCRSHDAHLILVLCNRFQFHPWRFTRARNDRLVADLLAASAEVDKTMEGLERM